MPGKETFFIHGCSAAQCSSLMGWIERQYSTAYCSKVVVLFVLREVKERSEVEVSAVIILHHRGNSVTALFPRFI